MPVGVVQNMEVEVSHGDVIIMPKGGVYVRIINLLCLVYSLIALKLPGGGGLETQTLKTCCYYYTDIPYTTNEGWG